jgi:hypothetical protein
MSDLVTLADIEMFRMVAELATTSPAGLVRWADVEPDMSQAEPAWLVTDRRTGQTNVLNDIVVRLGAHRIYLSHASTLPSGVRPGTRLTLKRVYEHIDEPGFDLEGMTGAEADEIVQVGMFGQVIHS